MTDRIAIRRALISVSDKTGLEDLGKALAAKGVELLSTGGTATALRGAGLEVRDVAEVTGSPEMMDGRVKTLHPRIHGGLLARRDLGDHMEALETHGIPAIDLLVVNLYPFEATIRKGAGWEEAVENVDIGGPAMIRAAAKNHASVTVIVDPADYAGLLGEIEADGATSEAFRIRAAQTAFARTAAYDAAVSGWMARAAGIEERSYAAIGGAHVQSMRYGENPHQKAAFYADGSGTGLAAAEQVQGKALSYNNINDTDAALELVAEFEGPACAIIKHANPCGVAAAAGLADAYQAAYDCDRTSAFGGIVAFNREIDAETAKAVTSIFTEVVIAPAASAEAREVFAAKNNLRLLIVPAMPDPARTGEVWRQVGGGYLLQDRDGARFDRSEARVVTKREPTEAEWADLAHAWTVAKHVKSNAIVYAKDGATVGVGAGQMSRLDSTLVASRKAREMAEVLGLAAPLTEGAALASDAFFPFPDGLLAAAEAGAKAVIQPGGAMRDDDVIAAADEAGLAMVFTGIRHFRH